MVIVIKCMESIPNTRKLLQYIPPKKSTTQKYPAGYGICDHSQYRVHPGKLRPGGGNSNSVSFSPLIGGKKPPTRLTWWKLKKSSSPSKWIPSTLNSIQPAWLGQKIQGVFRFFQLEFTPPVNIGGFFSWTKNPWLKTNAGGFQPSGSGVPGVSPADKNTTSSGTHGPNQFVRFPAARRRSESMEVAEVFEKWRDVGKEELGHKKKKDTHPGKSTCNRYQNGGGFGQMTLFFQLGWFFRFNVI